MTGCPVHTGNCAGMASTGQMFPTGESCTCLEKCSVKTTVTVFQVFDSHVRIRKPTSTSVPMAVVDMSGRRFVFIVVSRLSSRRCSHSKHNDVASVNVALSNSKFQSLRQ